MKSDPSKSSVKASLFSTFESASGTSSSSSSSSSEPSRSPAFPSFALKAVRNKDQIVITKAQFTKAMRATATAEERIKMMEAACKGSKTKLQKIDYTKLSQDDFSDSQFDGLVDMGKFLSTMKQHFIQHDMGHWFFFFPKLQRSKIRDEDNDSDWADNGESVNLFERWNQIGSSKETLIPIIADTVGWIQIYTDESSAAFLEDLEWTHKYLIDSMSPELAASVQSDLDEKYLDYQQGGPLTFAVMLDKAVNLTEGAILNIQTSIRNYKVSNVPGENIEVIARRLLHVYRSLENNNNLGRDLVHHLLKLFRTSSVPQFNELFQQWENDIIRGKDSLPDYKEILTKAKDYYDTLCSLRVWISPDSPGSVFPAMADTASVNGTSHDAESKPKKEKEPNPWLQRPVESMKVSSSPLRFEKHIGSSKVQWCDLCNKKRGKWTKSHYTDTHTGGKVQQSAFKAEGVQEDTDKQPVSNSTSEDASEAPKKMDFKQQLLKEAGTCRD